MKIPAKEFKNVKFAHLLVGKKEDNLILYFEKKVRINDKLFKTIYWDKTFTFEDGFLYIPNSCKVDFTSLFIARSVKRILTGLNSVHVYKDGSDINFIYSSDDVIKYDKSLVCMVNKK